VPSTVPITWLLVGKLIRKPCFSAQFSYVMFCGGRMNESLPSPLYATWAHCLHQPGYQVAHVALNAHEAVHVALRALLVADSAVQGALVAAGALRGALVASEALPVNLYAPAHR
jgi:hypothetical protein